MRKHARSLIRILTSQLGQEDVRFGVEVGVWRGELSADLLRSFPNLYLMMVDLWKPFDASAMHGKDNTREEMRSAFDAAKENTDFAKDRRIVEVGRSEQVATRQQDWVFDFWFFDADHFYESVRADLQGWWRTIKPGGIAAGHDYNGMGDRRKGWGVKQAVDEFFGEKGISINVEPGLVWWVKKP